ncbi:hypothetical protein GCM10022224_062840 [Nonomuraea antimicrobica]|uniref:Uncharacterized protein n=1 Tax=Nonomuraea antimicrobica TaxID=561173 RepID=A0ABP7CHJ4_9ACTN
MASTATSATVPAAHRRNAQASASASTAAPTAYGVYATAGTHGQSGSNPLKRTAAHPANGTTTIQHIQVRTPCIATNPDPGS